MHVTYWYSYNTPHIRRSNDSHSLTVHPAPGTKRKRKRRLLQHSSSERLLHNLSYITHAAHD